MSSSVASRPKRESSSSVVVRTAAIILGPFIVIGLLLFAVGLVFAAIGDAVCADYNFLSNDFCDEWHYDTPPEGALPQLTGWSMEWQELSCGSGGCPDRMYVLSPTEGTGSVENYREGLRDAGWDRLNDSHSKLLQYRKGNVELTISDARMSYLKRLYPSRLRQPGFVAVSVSLIDD